MAISEASKRAHILKYATEQFAVLGYDSTKIDNIASISGINKRHIYAMFQSKDELYSTVQSVLIRRLKDQFETVFSAQYACVRALYRAFLQVLANNPDFLRIWVRECLNTSLPGIWTIEAMDKCFAQLNRQILKMRDAGICPNLRENALRRAMCLAHGMLIERAIYGSFPDDDDAQESSEMEESQFQADVFNAVLDGIENLLHTSTPTGSTELPGLKS